jgi:hypothetical protein
LMMFEGVFKMCLPLIVRPDLWRSMLTPIAVEADIVARVSRDINGIMIQDSPSASEAMAIALCV